MAICTENAEEPVYDQYLQRQTEVAGQFPAVGELAVEHLTAEHRRCDWADPLDLAQQGNALVSNDGFDADGVALGLDLPNHFLDQLDTSKLAPDLGDQARRQGATVTGAQFSQALRRVRPHRHEVP